MKKFIRQVRIALSWAVFITTGIGVIVGPWWSAVRVLALGGALLFVLEPG